MDKKDKFKDTEIISQKVVEVRPDKIKLKIKERVSLRKKKRINFLAKLSLIFLTCLLGLYFGAKISERYLRYWKKTRMEFPSEENIPSLKPGQIYTITPE